MSEILLGSGAVRLKAPLVIPDGGTLNGCGATFFGDTEGVVLGNDCAVCHCVFRGFVTGALIHGDRCVISDCVFEDCEVGVYAEAVSDCSLRRNAFSGCGHDVCADFCTQLTVD